jgi:endoglucanase Acf2
VLTARRIPRPSAALVVAFAAMFTALSGTGYAALKITGANVANSTLTGADIKNKSLGPQEHKPDSLGGAQINESLLGTVPMAAKATDADTLGGSPASAYMTKKPRAFEAPIPNASNIANNAVIGTLADMAPGTYVVTAKLTYDNDGVVQSQTCTLHVPGGNDETLFTTDLTDTETLTLQKVTTSNAVFSPSVSCTSDGDDDIVGTGNIIAVRVD